MERVTTLINIAGLETPQDFLDKLQREIGRLYEAQHNGGLDCDVLDHSLNAIMTAWHLHEAVEKATNNNSINKSTKAYRDDVVQRCPELGILHDITSQIKHVKVSEPRRTNKEQPLHVDSALVGNITDEEYRRIADIVAQGEAAYLRPTNIFQTKLTVNG
ncbi:MAG: hypothetical protein RBS08_08545, partial [Bdellovibrionales bacterium]|nr:hypothetical protein [Bdellovibrionales bacterium]